ncbi:toprim domain-containing protein [Runella limosa]|uniref:toprim domain-containing protein n=1 Tax=Runella limosa TaxID=370978 RepID=UPI00041035B0|nr:toprim domain-containing protein [Runella limosa]
MERLTQEGKHNWEYYKARIDLVEFAIWKGFAINPKKTSRNYVVLKKEGDVIVVFFNQNTGYQGYFNPVDTKDRGSVLDFEFNRSQRNWKDVFGALDGYLNELKIGKIRTNKRVLRPTLPPTTEYDANYDFKFQPLSDFSYLNQRGITVKTASEACFQQQIFNKTFTFNGVLYINTAFPLRNQTGVVAAIVRNARYNKIECSRGDACWVSDLAMNDAENVTMVITESPIDALSYHQLFLPYPSEKRLYVATAGNLSDTQPQFIQYLVELYRPDKIVLANDKDKGGLVQNVKLMGALMYPDYPANLRVIVQSHGQKIIFSFRYEVENPSNEVPFLEGMVEKYFKNTKKFVASRNDGWVDVHIDTMGLALGILEEFLAKEKKPSNWLTIHKPHLKDFNEDLQFIAKRDPNYSDMSL